MTTAALVFALLPLLLSATAGSEIRGPLAAVVIGGNITSTMLTLILVPVVYTFLDGGSNLATRIMRRMVGSDRRADEPEGGQPAEPPPQGPPQRPQRPRRPQPQPQPTPAPAASPYPSALATPPRKQRGTSQTGSAASLHPSLPQSGPDKG